MKHYKQMLADRDAATKRALEALETTLQECRAILDQTHRQLGHQQLLVNDWYPELGYEWWPAINPTTNRP